MSILDWLQKCFADRDNYSPHKAQLNSIKENIMFSKDNYYATTQLTEEWL